MSRGFVFDLESCWAFLFFPLCHCLNTPGLNLYASTVMPAWILRHIISAGHLELLDVPVTSTVQKEDPRLVMAVMALMRGSKLYGHIIVLVDVTLKPSME